MSNSLDSDPMTGEDPARGADDDPRAGEAELLARAEQHGSAAAASVAGRMSGLAGLSGHRDPAPVGRPELSEPGTRIVPARQAVSISGKSVRAGDKVFRGLAAGSGGLLLVVMTAIAVFLVWKAMPAFSGNSGNLLTTQAWRPQADPPFFGIAAVFFGTVVSAVIAMIIGVPVAIGIALFIAHYANRRLATVFGAVVDLLAAVPSLVFGMWGLYFLVPRTRGFQNWLSDYFGWIPLFHNTTATSTAQYGQSLLMAGIVLAIMIIPTVSAVTREVFLQVPAETMDAAWALGATKWEMVRTAILPFGRAGMISAAMLGLGRALGETIAVALVLNSGFVINWHLNEPGGDTFASLIALKFGEASGSEKGIPALVFAGLCLFIITLLVNSAARLVIARRKEFTA